jgi:opacity protein-like surface antigen
MLNRSALILVAGAAMVALEASAASGQDTTRTRRPTSSQRIRVGKEAPGEVTVRVDTVTMYRTDTLQLPPRVDTVTRTNTVTRTVHDTVTQMIPIKVPTIGGFYAGLAAGGSLPAAPFNNPNRPGWRVEVPVGFDFVGTPFGLRLNGGYANYSTHDWVSPFLDNAQIWNLDGDVKIRIASATPKMMRLQLYGLAGATWNHFKNVVETNDNGILFVGDSTRNSTTLLPLNLDTDWHSGWGFNTGAGVEVGRGHANVFAEVRYTRWNGVNSNISNVPLVIGVNWY